MEHADEQHKYTIFWWWINIYLWTNFFPKSLKNFMQYNEQIILIWTHNWIGDRKFPFDEESIYLLFNQFHRYGSKAQWIVPAGPILHAFHLKVGHMCMY